MQLFAGELTNQNREYYKVNDNNNYLRPIFITPIIYKLAKDIVVTTTWNHTLRTTHLIVLPVGI